MVFSSVLFTFVFLPAVLLIYFLAKKKYRNYILVFASFVFYAYGESRYAGAMIRAVSLLIFSILINYFSAMIIEYFDRKVIQKLLLCVTVLLNLGVLFFFKYLDFAISIVNSVAGVHLNFLNIALPLGISFFTFQGMSYVIDVYRKTVPVQKNPFYVALYITFFPQLVAGPIVRYSTIEKQIIHRQTCWESLGEGARRFMLGFCKKVILANNLAVVAEEVFTSGDVAQYSLIYLWIGAVCFSLQIYYDFSGYSDMAIGLGRMFGFCFEENFNYPFASRSVTEFWRRWHISLGRWFRDYVYIPLGGSKVGKLHHVFNLFVVWLLTGLWHGANYTFIVWGLWNFAWLFLEKFVVNLEKRGKVFATAWRFLTLIAIIFGWVYFNSPDILYGTRYCTAMLGGYHNPWEIDTSAIRLLREYGIYMIAGILFSAPLAKWVNARTDAIEKLRKAKIIVMPLIYGVSFLWAVSFLILGAHNPFIYFNF